MPKIVGTRERVHQPFYDSLIRVDGDGDLRSTNQGVFGAVQSRSQLFVRQGADLSISNLTTGGFFPSDQTFITLAVRVWTYFRFNPEAPCIVDGLQAPIGGVAGQPVDRIQRVHKLYHQCENQFFWQLICGDKPQLTTFTAYTPFAGGLDGFFAGSGQTVTGAGAGSGIDPFLGTAANYTVMAGTPNINSTGATIITGNLALSPAAAVIGFPPGIITGVQDVANPAAVQAKSDLTAAYIALSALGPGTVIGAALGGLTLTAGTYSTAAGFGLTGNLTLDGGGNPNARFVLISATTLITANASTVTLVNGARAANVYWVVGSSATLGTTSVFRGNILALTSITLTTGATVVGRLLARNGTLTLDSNVVGLDPLDPAAGAIAGAAGYGGANGNSLPRANNGIPTSSALMRLARPVLIPPRQGFQVVAIASPIGQTTGSSVIEQLNGLVPNTAPASTITGGVQGTSGLSVPGKDDIEKDVKYLIDGIHSRDVL